MKLLYFNQTLQNYLLFVSTTAFDYLTINSNCLPLLKKFPVISDQCDQQPLPLQLRRPHIAQLTNRKLTEIFDQKQVSI